MLADVRQLSWDRRPQAKDGRTREVVDMKLHGRVARVQLSEATVQMADQILKVLLELNSIVSVSKAAPH